MSAERWVLHTDRPMLRGAWEDTIWKKPGAEHFYGLRNKMLLINRQNPRRSGNPGRGTRVLGRIYERKKKR